MRLKLLFKEKLKLPMTTDDESPTREVTGVRRYHLESKKNNLEKNGGGRAEAAEHCMGVGVKDKPQTGMPGVML